MNGSIFTRDLIKFSCEKTLPNSPKDFEVIEIGAKLACNLNKQWHSRLPKIHWSNVVRNTHYVCFAAEFKGNYYAVGIWSSPVAQNRFKDGKTMLELRRLAICDECPKNTASRMIKMMIKKIRLKFPEIKRLISYQDTDVHKGTIYSASNWKNSSESVGVSWTTKNRKRNPDQTTAKKIRWEYSL